MKIVWSKAAEKQFSKINCRYQTRIKSRLENLDDNAAPVADIKISHTRKSLSLTPGDYRVIYTLKEQQSDTCYVVSVKRRTTTTYLHEEHREYECSVN